MIDIDALVRVIAPVLRKDYESEYQADHLTDKDFEPLSREVAYAVRAYLESDS